MGKKYYNLVEYYNIEHFVWIPTKNFWGQNLLKNIDFLESNKEFVDSSGLTKWFGDKEMMNW